MIHLDRKDKYFLNLATYDMIKSQISSEFLFKCVIKILTACRMYQISIAWCQDFAFIHSFLTVYGKGGEVDEVEMGQIKVLVQEFSHFRVVWDQTI